MRMGFLMSLALLPVGLVWGETNAAVAVPTEGLILYYSFDNPTDDGTVPDDSDHGMTGQINGAEWVTNGVSGSGCHFDGEKDHVVVPDASALSAYTISVWVRLDDLKPRSIITRTSDAGPASEWSHQLGVAHSNNLEHYIFPNDYPECHAVDPMAVETGTWHHVVGTGADSGAVVLYVDGSRVAAADLPRELWRGGKRWLIGHTVGFNRDDYRGYRGYFHGTLDELRIYNRVLAEAEILALGTRSGIPVAASAPAEADVEALIRQLGAADAKTRKEARARLQAMGRKALPVLLRHRNDRDPEIRTNVDELLKP